MKKYNLKLKKGTDFLFLFRIKDAETGDVKDLTGYSGAMKIKDKYNGSVIATADVNITSNDVVQCNIDKTATAALPAGVAVYDISLTNNDNKTAVIFYGEIEILNNTNS